MKIGLFTDYFTDTSSFGGGIGKVVNHLASGLAELGHKVYVFTNSSSNNDEVYINGNLAILKFARTLRIEGTDLSLRLLWEPLRHKIDIAHIEGGVLATLSGLLYSALRRTPLVITIHHTGDKWKNPIKNLILKTYELLVINIVLKKANKIIIPSKYLLLQSSLVKRYWKKTVYVPNGVESLPISLSKEEARKRLNIPNDIKVILFVGTLCRRKGVHILLNAARYVLSKYPRCTFILVGRETKEATEFRRTVEKDKLLSENVVFTGFVNEKLKNIYYRAADIFVLPSLSEGFGLVLLEAARYNLPLVVSDLPSFKIIIHDGYNGLFSRRGDPADLANKILYLLRNEKIAKRIGRNAGKLALRFSWRQTTNKTLGVYVNIIKQGN